MLTVRHGRHDSGDGGQNVHGRIVVLLGQGPVQDDVAVENRPGRIGNRLVEVVPVYEDRIEAGDGAFRRIARPLQKTGQLRIDGRRIPTRHRRFPGSQADFPLGHAESGQGVHHEKDVLALVPEVLGDGRGGQGRLLPDQGGLVRSRNHDHRPLHSFGPDIVLDKLPDLTAPLANEGHHRDVRPRVSRKHAHQGGLADAGTREDADTLALSDRDQAVDGLDPEGQGL